MMTECWNFQPDDRPSFSELYANTSNYLERVAGYLEMNFNPFGGMGRSTLITPGEANECENKSLPDPEIHTPS